MWIGIIFCEWKSVDVVLRAHFALAHSIQIPGEVQRGYVVELSAQVIETFELQLKGRPIHSV